MISYSGVLSSFQAYMSMLSLFVDLGRFGLICVGGDDLITTTHTHVHAHTHTHTQPHSHTDIEAGRQKATQTDTHTRTRPDMLTHTHHY